MWSLDKLRVSGEFVGIVAGAGAGRQTMSEISVWCQVWLVSSIRLVDSGSVGNVGL